MARQKKEGMDDFVDALREWLGIGPIPQSPAAARENARQDHGAMEECVWFHGDGQTKKRHP